MNRKADIDGNEFFNFCPILVEMLRRRTPYGRTGKTFPGAGALSTTNNLHVLRQLCLAFRPKRTLEIGLCYGGSALVFTASHRDIWGNPSRQHVCIDPYQHSDWDDSGLYAIERAGLEDYLEFRAQRSCIELPKLLAASDRFDLAYIDGSHLFEDVFIDAYYVMRLLNIGGIVVFDDSSCPHVAKVLAFISRAFAKALRERDVSSFRQDGGVPVRYRLARMFNRVQVRAFEKTGPVERPWNAPYIDF